MPAVDIQMVPPVEEAPPAKTVGIIYPPPEVRNIVDKTANFVARNGPEFETRIRQNEINNPKFNFLNPADPYHAYYQHKVKDFREGKGPEPHGLKVHLPASRQQEVTKVAELIVPKEPPPEFEFTADPPSISAFDLDVVKLTAQFVARNGRQFLTNLMNREQRNYQFDFLRPQHSLFNYFTKLVEQYTKILIPPKDLLNKLKKECDNPKEVLDQVKYRVEWAKYQERERQKEEAALEKERVSYAQIDWHDFVVVETVDFQPSEQGNLPPPTTPEEVGARLLAQERFNTHGNDVEMDVSSEEDGEGDEEEDDDGEEGEEDDDGTANTQVQDMEQDSSEEEGDEPSQAKQSKERREKSANPPLPPLPTQPPPLPPAPDQVIVRKDYNPKAPKAIVPAPATDQFLVSPITGEKIPADKLQEHMRIGLLDPKWIEQRDRTIAERREQEEVYAPGSAIDSSLKQLAERRTDIFGVGAEEAGIGKKIGEEEIRPKEKVTWDGHTASMEKVSQKARENISIEEQIKVIHQAKGLVEDATKERIGPAIPKAAPPSLSKGPPKPPMGMPSQVFQPRPPMPRPPMQPRMPMMMPMAPQPGMVLLPPRPPMPPAGIRPPPPRMMAQPMRMMGQPPGMIRPPQMAPPPKPLTDEPPNKRQKTEESLIPEEQFMRMNKGPVTFKVVVPSIPDKPEWKLAGQTLSLSLPLTDNVSVIKAKLNEELGMPAGKQKLQYEGLFIKDSNTLAYYNFNNRAVVSLQLKERGGRKK